MYTMFKYIIIVVYLQMSNHLMVSRYNSLKTPHATIVYLVHKNYCITKHIGQKTFASKKIWSFATHSREKGSYTRLSASQAFQWTPMGHGTKGTHCGSAVTSLYALLGVSVLGDASVAAGAEAAVWQGTTTAIPKFYTKEWKTPMSILFADHKVIQALF
jgi:hypothetical protein